MELQKHAKLIDDFINDRNAITLLFDTYQATPEQEKEKFVLALIGSAVTSHKLLQHKFDKKGITPISLA